MKIGRVVWALVAGVAAAGLTISAWVRPATEPRLVVEGSVGSFLFYVPPAALSLEYAAPGCPFAAAPLKIYLGGNILPHSYVFSIPLRSVGELRLHVPPRHGELMLGRITLVDPISGRTALLPVPETEIPSSEERTFDLPLADIGPFPAPERLPLLMLLAPWLAFLLGAGVVYAGWRPLAAAGGRLLSRPPVSALPSLADWVPLAMALLFIPMTVMAIVSAYNAHNDEISHFEADRYYVSRWIPPAVADPATLPALSEFGVTYLTPSFTPFYLANLLVGKWMALFGEGIVVARCFNLFLWALLCGVAWRRPVARIVFLPLLLTPQIWYFFSAANTDGLGLFLAALTVLQAVDPESALRRFGREKGAFSWRLALPMALTLFLLWLGPPHYWMVFPVVPLALFAARPETAWKARLAPVFRRLAAVGLLFAVAALPLTLYNEAVNHFEKPQRLLAQYQQYAEPRFRPVNPAAFPVPRALRSRGVPLRFMFVHPRWYYATWQTLAGCYQYVRITGPVWYYAVLFAAWSALAFLVLRASVRAGEWVPAAGWLVAAAVALAVSILYSWIVDYQPQGRYLFGGLVAFGWPIFAVWERLGKAARGLMIFCWGLGLWSFLFVALRLISKAP